MLTQIVLGAKVTFLGCVGFRSTEALSSLECYYVVRESGRERKRVVKANKRTQKERERDAHNTVIQYEYLELNPAQAIHRTVHLPSHIPLPL